MGWNNPDIPWRELERRLSGRPDLPQDEAPVSRRRAAYRPQPLVRGSSGTPFAELHAHSSYSFLDGASSPAELVEEAVRLGLESLTLTDHDGMYGIVQLFAAARTYGLPVGYGAELGFHAPPRTHSDRMTSARSAVPDPDAEHLLVLARDQHGYANLCRAISTAQLRGGAKGHPAYDWDELAELADNRWLVLTGCRKGKVLKALTTQGLPAARRALDELVSRFGRDSVAVELTYDLDPVADERYDALALLAAEQHLSIVATTGAHFHAPSRRPLATTVAAIRARRSLDEIDGWLPASGAVQHLRSGDEMAARFARWPDAVTNAARLGREVAFELRLVAPELPPFPDLEGHPDELSYLRHLAYEGADRRYGGKPHEAVARARIEHELDIIGKRDFPGYFLIVREIAKFCRDKGILAQGRGSAANSAVCYALGVTAIDPIAQGDDGHTLIFERFLGPHRGDPPDIDIDIESGLREQVIQHVYEMYGREHTAQVANVISYRPRSAVRDVARALGYAAGQQDAWAKEIERGYYWGQETEHQTEGIPTQVIDLAEELQKAPRHLGIHSGGMVICDRPVIEVCPVEWGRFTTRTASGARKPSRTVLQWDKDDCAEINLVKFDLLGLGMLSALHGCFDLVREHHGRTLDLDLVPKEQPCVYDMLCAADAIGVFQVESRAQLGTLPRLRPRKMYDLAIEVALIRPGPIQGDAVHPYIRRRHGKEEVAYGHSLMEPSLKRILGIPLFQEQLMELAIDVAGFTPADADQLRRAMGSKRGVERIDALRERLYAGMAGNGITGELADQIYGRIQAFASFGFAESHAMSFASLVYVSSWLKRHYPAAFCAALLNAQPMGFYSPQSLVQDARRHGIEVRPPSLLDSAAEATLEPATFGRSSGHSDTARPRVRCECGDEPVQPAVRLGLSGVRTIGTDVAGRIVAERQLSPFESMADLARRVGLTAEQVEALATSGALACFETSRRDALWVAAAAATARPGQLSVEVNTPVPQGIPPMDEAEQLIADLWSTGITTTTYPTALIRDRLAAQGILTAEAVLHVPDRTRVTVGGVVTHRQRPATAHGVTFLNIEDETGMVNVIVPENVWARYRKVAREAGGMLIRGMLERVEDSGPDGVNGTVVNVLAERLERLHLGIRNTSRDFR